MRGTIAGGAGIPTTSITDITTGIMGTTITVITIGALTPIIRDTNASYLGPSMLTPTRSMESRKLR